MTFRVPFASLLGLLAAAVFAAPAAAQQGNIQGTVVNAATMEPLEAVQVFIPGTQHGTLTDARGRFLLLNVPAGRHTVSAELLGYATGTEQVTVRAGETATASLELRESALRIDEIVVTGVVGETPKTKIPFSVDKINAEDLPVPAASPEAAIQGKVAGARVVQGTGQPGEGASILLRGATSINTSGRSQSPLLIVDGVIVQGGLEDLNALDIESVEVVKGAAAASLYGSRAANGVIQITTKRGAGLGDDQIRYTVRSEYGRSDLTGSIPLTRSHPYLMNEAKTKFIGPDGGEYDYLDAPGVVLEGPKQDPFRTFQDNLFPAPRFNQINRFFDPGDFLQNLVSVTGRRGSTNYYASFSNFDQSGVLFGHEGYERQNYRINLDHGMSEDFTLSLSSLYATSDQDEISTTPFYLLTFQNPHVDLLRRNPDMDPGSSGWLNLVVRSDPHHNEPNPLYEVLNRDVRDAEERFMGSALVRYAPIDWFDAEANISYDRTDWRRFDLFPKGYQSLVPDPINLGQLERETFFSDALNASITAGFHKAFGDLTTRSKLRYLYEAQDFERFSSRGMDFIVKDVPDLDVVQGTKAVSSVDETIRSEGYFFITGLDYKDRYIVDGLIRRDGSSLFGEDERWQTYYRLSGAWRPSQESWWFAPEAISELKLRGSLGTAGGRPNFYAQYETYSVAGGTIRPATLGNTELKPEFATELELGVDALFFDRLTATVVYANSVVEDQILLVPLVGPAGFTHQWRNAGTLESDTWELSLESQILQRGDFSWFSRLMWDKTETIITELNMPAYQVGPFYVREGEVLGTFYGDRWATSCADLPTGVDCGLFQTNDDGYLVYVGAGNTFRSGVGPDGIAGTADDLWGTSAKVGNLSYKWGMPIYAFEVDPETGNLIGGGSDILELGNTQPDWNAAFSNSFDWRGLSLYTLFDASWGFDIYNQTRQWAYREFRSAEVDQVGKPEELKKPLGYYATGKNTLYNVNGVNSHFVEDGSYVKLREASLSFTLGPDLLSSFRLDGLERMRISLIGRNLHTWTDFSGYDPEVGGAAFGASAIDRRDTYQYPNFRTITAAVEVVF